MELKQIDIGEIDYQIMHYDYRYLYLNQCHIFKLSRLTEYVDNLTPNKVYTTMWVDAVDDNFLYISASNQMVDIKIKFNTATKYWQYGDYILITQGKEYSTRDELLNFVVLERVDD